MFGFSRGRALKKRSAAVSTFDPATLSLTLWQRDFPGGTSWAGTSSAGTSGSRTFSDGGGGASFYPSSGTAQNGKIPAFFDGTDDKAILDSNLDSILTNDAWSFAGLIYLESTNAAAAQPYDDDQILAGGGGVWGIGVSNSGVQCYQYNGSVIVPSGWVACGTGAYHWVQCKRDSTKVYTKVDGGAWTSASLASGDMAPGVRLCRMGRDENSGTVFINCRMLDLLMSNTTWDDATFANIRGYGDTRYNLSLT